MRYSPPHTVKAFYSLNQLDQHKTCLKVSRKREDFRGRNANAVGPIRPRLYTATRILKQRLIHCQCLPEDRTWPGPRCQRCDRYDYPCSQSRTKADEVDGLASTVSSTATTDFAENVPAKTTMFCGRSDGSLLVTR